MAILLGYVVFIVMSHSVVLPPILDVPLVLVGWLSVLALFVWTRFTGEHRPQELIDLLRPFPFTIAFAIVAASALFLALGWDVPSLCHGDPINCVKGYDWSTDNARYFHTTADGIHGQISANIYLQEVGQHLRSAATFGVFALCGAFVVAPVVGPAPGAPPRPGSDDMHVDQD